MIYIRSQDIKFWKSEQNYFEHRHFSPPNLSSVRAKGEHTQTWKDVTYHQLKKKKKIKDVVHQNTNGN